MWRKTELQSDNTRVNHPTQNIWKNCLATRVTVSEHLNETLHFSGRTLRFRIGRNNFNSPPRKYSPEHRSHMSRPMEITNHWIFRRLQPSVATRTRRVEEFARWPAVPNRDDYCVQLMNAQNVRVHWSRNPDQFGPPFAQGLIRNETRRRLRKATGAPRGRARNYIRAIVADLSGWWRNNGRF